MIKPHLISKSWRLAGAALVGLGSIVACVPKQSSGASTATEAPAAEQQAMPAPPSGRTTPVARYGQLSVRGPRLVGANGEPVVLRGHTEEVWGVAWAPDGKRLATASWDFTVKLWDPATGQEALTLRATEAPCWGVAWAPDGRRLAGGSADGKVHVWDATPPPEPPP